MSEQPPTRYKIFRYDPDRDEVVLVREGVAERIDKKTLNPDVQKHLDDFLARYGTPRKSA